MQIVSRTVDDDDEKNDNNLYEDFMRIKENDSWSRELNYNVLHSSMRYNKETFEFNYLSNDDNKEDEYDWIIRKVIDTYTEEAYKKYSEEERKKIRKECETGFCVGRRVYWRGKKSFTFLVEDDTSEIRDRQGSIATYVGVIDPLIVKKFGGEYGKDKCTVMNGMRCCGLYSGHYSSIHSNQTKNDFKHFYVGLKDMERAGGKPNESKEGMKFEWKFTLDFDNGTMIAPNGSVIFRNLIPPMSVCFFSYERWVKCAIKN